MIIGLLALIIGKGTTVFWPKEIALVQFDEDGSTQFRGGHRVAGIYAIEKGIDPGSLTEQQILSDREADRREFQLFTGNKDVYGQGFAYFPEGDVVSVTYPEAFINIERMTWGNAIGLAQSLTLPDGTEIEAGSAEFRKALRNAVAEVRDRRKEINRIERGEIGAISSQITQYRFDERYLRRLNERTPAQEAELARVRQKLEALQAAYEPLAATADALRKRNHEGHLSYQLASGETRILSFGEMVSFHYPNDMNVFQKLGVFFVHIYEFLTNQPREANTEGGIFPAIFGTFVMTLLMSVAVTPFGVLAAIYLREYAKQGPLVRAVRIAVNNLAGVPSIVFGVFGLGFFIYFFGASIDQWFFPRAVESNTPVFGTGGILWASLTLALMTVPVVIVATEEALAAVSRGVREGSLACGASKWQTIQYLVLPASLPGILTGLILAMARGAGEVAPLMLVGVVALAPNLPIDSEFPFIHLERKFMHLGFHIYDLGFQSPDSEAARPMVFATTLVLILLVIVLNLAAILLRNHLKKKYTSSAF